MRHGNKCLKLFLQFSEKEIQIRELNKKMPKLFCQYRYFSFITILYLQLKMTLINYTSKKLKLDHHMGFTIIFIQNLSNNRYYETMLK